MDFHACMHIFLYVIQMEKGMIVLFGLVGRIASTVLKNSTNNLGSVFQAKFVQNMRDMFFNGALAYHQSIRYLSV